MQPTRVIANLSVPDIGEARDFYMDYLGLSVEGFNWAGLPASSLPAAGPSFNSSPAMPPLRTTL